MHSTTKKAVVGLATILLGLAMTQTAFAGLPPELKVDPGEIAAGGAITVTGQGCFGGYATIYIDGEMVADDITPTSLGAWSMVINTDGDLKAGVHTVTATCTSEGEPYTYDGKPFTVTGAQDPTTTTTTSTTEAPTTTQAPGPDGDVDGTGDAAPGDGTEAELAYTGQNHMPTILTGLGIIAAGFAVLVISRRRVTA